MWPRLQAALDLLIRLNDRFALDGGAPPSYGGLLWCLGWRDRPGPNGRPTARPTSVMARRVQPGDLERLARRRCAEGALPLLPLRALLASTPPPAAANAAAAAANANADANTNADASSVAPPTAASTPTEPEVCSG